VKIPLPTSPRGGEGENEKPIKDLKDFKGFFLVKV